MRTELWKIENKKACGLNYYNYQSKYEYEIRDAKHEDLRDIIDLNEKSMVLSGKIEKRIWSAEK